MSGSCRQRVRYDGVPAVAEGPVCVWINDRGEPYWSRSQRSHRTSAGSDGRRKRPAKVVQRRDPLMPHTTSEAILRQRISGLGSGVERLRPGDAQDVWQYARAHRGTKGSRSEISRPARRWCSARTVTPKNPMSSCDPAIKWITASRGLRSSQPECFQRWQAGRRIKPFRCVISVIFGGMPEARLWRKRGHIRQ